MEDSFPTLPSPVRPPSKLKQAWHRGHNLEVRISYKFKVELQGHSLFYPYRLKNGYFHSWTCLLIHTQYITFQLLMVFVYQALLLFLEDTFLDFHPHKWSTISNFTPNQQPPSASSFRQLPLTSISDKLSTTNDPSSYLPPVSPSQQPQPLSSSHQLPPTSLSDRRNLRASLQVEKERSRVWECGNNYHCGRPWSVYRELQVEAMGKKSYWKGRSSS